MCFAQFGWSVLSLPGALEANVVFEDPRASPTYVPLNHSERVGEALPGRRIVRVGE